MTVFRYVIEVCAEIPPAAHAGPRTAHAWRPVQVAPNARAWVSESRPDPLRARQMSDGCLMGWTAAPVEHTAQLEATWGAYVAVHADPATGAVSIWRDPSGRVPGMTARTPRGHLVFSHLADLAGFDAFGLDIDWDYLAVHLLGEHMPARRTGLRGVSELVPGEALRIRGGRTTSHRLWRPAEISADVIRDLPRAQAAFRSAAEEATAVWASHYTRATLDLSGGLDSSIILGLVSTVHPALALTCLNAVVGHEESDERPYARAAARLHQARLHEIDLADDLPDYGGALPGEIQPRPTSRLLSIGFGRPALDAAREVGAQAYLTGSGGDHVFFQSVPTTCALDQLLVSRNPAAWLRTAYLAARLNGQTFTGVLSEALDRPHRDEQLKTVMAFGSPFVRVDLAEDLELETWIHPWAIQAAANTPPAKFIQICRLAELQRHYDRIGRAEELDEVHPFMSQPVLEAALRTPSWMFALGGVRRGLQRETFRDLLPPEIHQRRTKGATTSRTVRALSVNLEILRDTVLDGPLGRSGLIEPKRLDEALTRRGVLESRNLGHLCKVVSVGLWLRQAQAFIRAELSSPPTAARQAVP